MISLKTVCTTALCLSLMACGSGGPKGWTVKGDLDGKTLYVEADPKIMTNFDSYQSAVDDACGGACAMVQFYLPGDVIPTKDRPAAKFPHTTPAAIWARGEFTHWDCNRAPAEGVPSEISCGAGGQAFYGPVLAIGVRDGWVTGCHMPEFGGRAVIDAYLKTVKDEDRRAQLLEGYQHQFNSAQEGPDDPAFCNKAKAKIDREAREAKKLLEDEIKKAG